LNTFARRFLDELLPVIVVMVMPIMMVVMMVILHPYDDLGLRRDGCDATEEEQSSKRVFIMFSTYCCDSSGLRSASSTGTEMAQIMDWTAMW
jgi:hypothetical protein